MLQQPVGRLIESYKRAITELIETIDRILSPKTAVAQKPKNKSSEYPKLYHEGFGGLGVDILIDPNKNRWYGGSLDFNFGNSLLRLGVNYGYNARNEFTESWGERDAYGHQGYSSTDRETKTSSGSSSLMLVNLLGRRNHLSAFIYFWHRPSCLYPSGGSKGQNKGKTVQGRANYRN